MVNNGHMELEHPSVWLIKQEVSRKHSNVVRQTKDRTGKAIHDSRLQTFAGKQLTASDMGILKLNKWNVLWGLLHFSYALGTLSLNKLDRNEGEGKKKRMGHCWLSNRKAAVAVG